MEDDKDPIYILKSPEKVDNKKLLDATRRIKEKNVIFSFATFDRSHELFNLGAQEGRSETMEDGWFICLLEMLHAASKLTWPEFKRETAQRTHEIEWEKYYAKKPNVQNDNWWQFGVGKQGRVYGFLVDNVFFIHWLDPHHNGKKVKNYRGAQYFQPAQLPCKKLEEENATLKEKNEMLKEANEILENISDEDVEVLFDLLKGLGNKN